MTNVRLIAAADPEWNQWIESTSHDVYHTAAYHRVVTFEGDGSPQLLVYGSPGTVRRLALSPQPDPRQHRRHRQPGVRRHLRVWV